MKIRNHVSSTASASQPWLRVSFVLAVIIGLHPQGGRTAYYNPCYDSITNVPNSCMSSNSIWCVPTATNCIPNPQWASICSGWYVPDRTECITLCIKGNGSQEETWWWCQSTEKLWTVTTFVGDPDCAPVIPNPDCIGTCRNWRPQEPEQKSIASADYEMCEDQEI